jgi:hypothetical protein
MAPALPLGPRTKLKYQSLGNEHSVNDTPTLGGKGCIQVDRATPSEEVGLLINKRACPITRGLSSFLGWKMNAGDSGSIILLLFLQKQSLKE